MKYVQSLVNTVRQGTCFCLMILFILGASLSVHAEDYDLEKYLARVRGNNLDLAVAAKELELAKQYVNQARSAFFPVIAAQGGYTRNFLDTTQTMAVASLPGGGPLIFDDVVNNYDNELSFGVGLTQTIFDAGAIAGYSQAKKGQSIQEQAFETNRRHIMTIAKKMYLQTQLAQNLAAILENSEHTSMEIYQSTERKYKAGAVTELDLLMAEVDWKNRIPQTMEARKNADMAMIAFKKLAGIPASESVNLTENRERLPALPDDQSLDQTLSMRPDYRALVLSRELVDIEKKAALGAFLPKLTGGLSYALAGMGNGSSLIGDYDYQALKLNLSVNVPLFTGGYRLSKVQEAKLEQEKAELSLARKKDSIESELLEIRLRLDEAAERVKTATLTESMAQRAVSLSRNAYANGLVTQLSVNQAIDNLSQASLGFQNAIYEYLVAWYDWDLATGMVE
ncbi:TolC family protein [Brucepastera parasyntrophica]|uniref:TolC family protein n=1 Tax=Brucepastera parasyntrophica TaxID=2880008 RepID=UPI00210B7DD2|nr:TolC family protein [Brucepastera parasyntrophica]ULQ58569.1 TolC family protein [Brucepastera parasyntrophica]